MIDITKQYTTRDGKQVKIFITNGGPRFPIIGAVVELDGQCNPSKWKADGTFYFSGTPSNYDLVEVKQKFSFERWCNIYCTSGIFDNTEYSTKEAADRHGFPSRIACICVTFSGTEGEGLE